MGVVCGTPRKSSVLGTICLLKHKRYLSPFKSQSQYKCCLGDRPPILGEGVELGGRVWYPLKAHHNGHNLSFEIDTQSRFAYEQVALQILGLGTQLTNWREGWV